MTSELFLGITSMQGRITLLKKGVALVGVAIKNFVSHPEVRVGSLDYTSQYRMRRFHRR